MKNYTRSFFLTFVLLLSAARPLMGARDTWIN